jgi:hypothetical protein
MADINPQNGYKINVAARFPSAMPKRDRSEVRSISATAIKTSTNNIGGHGPNGLLELLEPVRVHHVATIAGPARPVPPAGYCRSLTSQCNAHSLAFRPDACQSAQDHYGSAASENVVGIPSSRRNLHNVRNRPPWLAAQRDRRGPRGVAGLCGRCERRWTAHRGRQRCANLFRRKARISSTPKPQFGPVDMHGVALT